MTFVFFIVACDILSVNILLQLNYVKMPSLVSISPVGQTPRSEKNAPSLEDEEIDEEIEEQLSGGEDLLKSEASTVSIDTCLSVHMLLLDTTMIIWAKF